MPGRFRFGLEVVRKVRSVAEREQQRVVAGVRRHLAQLEAEVEQTAEEHRRWAEGARDFLAAGTLDMGGLRQRQLHLGWLRERRAELERQRTEVERHLRAAREKLIELVKQRKVLDKLRERRLARHNEEVRREERVTMDEAAAHSHVRRAVGGIEWV